MTYYHRIVMSITMLAFLCCFAACEKESIEYSVDVIKAGSQFESENSFEIPTFPLFSELPFDEAYPNAHRHFLRQMEKIQITSRNEVFLFDDVDVNNYIAHESPEGTSYVWYLPSTQSNSKVYYNLVFEQYPEGFDDPFILEYELSDDFNQSFHSSVASLSQFTGVVRKYLLAQVLDQRGLSFDFCYQLIFEDSGGGHGSYEDGPGTTTTTGTSSSSNETTSGLGSSGLFECIECVECSCESHPCGTGSCTCGEGGSGTKWYYVMVKCGPSNFVQQQNDHEHAGDGRGVLEDCYKILLDHGVMPPGYVHTEEEIDEEDCVPIIKNFVEKNRFSFKRIKEKNINLDECCTSGNQQDCTWEELVDGFNLQFDLEEYQTEVLPYLKENNIKLWEVIDSEIYGITDDGIMKLDIDPINMVTSTDMEIFEQIVKVLEGIHTYFCEGNSYEPIDWQDYFTSANNRNGTVSWGGCNPTEFEMRFEYGENIYLMDTDPGWNGQTSTGYVATWNSFDSNIGMMVLKVPFNCTDKLIDIMYSNCD